MPRHSDKVRPVISSARSEARKEIYRRDFRRFCPDQLRIKGIAPGELLRFQLDSGQERLYRVMEEQEAERGYIRCVTLKGRQSGWSTLSQALLFHRAALNQNYNTLLIANDDPTTARIFEMAHLFWEEMSEDIRPMIRHSTKREIRLDNPDKKLSASNPGLHSRMDFQHSGNIMAGTGTTRQAAHFSEVAKWNRKDTQLLVSSLLPAIHPVPGTVVIWESTAYIGAQYFREQCERARSGKAGLAWCFSPWWLNNRNQIALSRGEKIVPRNSEEKRLIKLALRGQKEDDVPPHQITQQQLKWYRERVDEFGDLFDQEYPCIAVGQRVGTTRGLIPIEELQVGDTVATGDVTEVRHTGVLPVVRVRTRNGYSVIVTPDHQLIGDDGAPIPAANSIGKLISIGRPSFARRYHIAQWADGPMTVSLRIDEDIGRFLGYFMGDGSFDHFDRGGRARSTLSIACDAQDADVIEDVRALISKLFGEPTIRTVGTKRGGTELRKGCQGFARFAKGLGIYRQAAPHRLVCVPECIWRSPASVVKEFLRGVFEADGCKRKDRSILLFSKHRKFLDDIQVLLLGFGIESRVTTAPRRNSNGAYTANELALRSLETDAFGERIGFVSRRKRDRHLRHTKPARPRGRPQMKGVDEVGSVEDLRMSLPVYDATVSPSHIFDANGVAVHNCDFESAWVQLDVNVFDRNIMREMLAEVCDPMEYVEIFPGPEVKTVRAGGRPFSDQSYIAIWQRPIDGVFYDMGVDVAPGIEGGDWTVAEIIRRDTGEQVAEYHKHIDPVDLATELYWLGKYYKNAQIIVEMNNVGYITGNRLSLLAYPYIYIWRHRERSVPTLSTYAGWKTTYESKKLLVGNARHLFVHRKVMIHSRVLYDEMTQYVRYDENSYAADQGNDDCVEAWMIGLQGGIDESFGAPRTPIPEKRDPILWTPYLSDPQAGKIDRRDRVAEMIQRDFKGLA